MKIGIIRCQEQSNYCPGHNCFPALYERRGRFNRYSKDENVELVGFDTCGGCARHNKADKIVERALRLKNIGAETIHISCCLYLWCPFKDLYMKELKEKVGIPIIEGTHEFHGGRRGTTSAETADLHPPTPLNAPPPDAFEN